MDPKFKHLVRFGVVLLCIIIAIPLLIMGSSPFIKRAITSNGQELIGCEVEVDHLLINPFTGSVKLSGVSSQQEHTKGDFIRFDQVDIKLNYLALLTGKICVDHVYVDGCYVQLVRYTYEKDGKQFTSTNISDVMEYITSQPSDSEPLDVEIHDIRLTGGEIAYVDEVTAHQWKLQNIHFELPGLDLNGATEGGLSLDFPTGGTIRTAVAYDADKSDYTVTVDIENLNPDVLLPIVQDYLRVSSLKADVDGHLQIVGSLSASDHLQAKGWIGMQHLQMLDSDGDQVGAMDEARLVLKQYDMSRNMLEIDTLLMSGLTANMERSDRYNTLSRLTVKHEDLSADAGSSAKVPAMSWRVKYIRLSAKDLTYEDNAMAEPFETSISSIVLSGSNLKSGAQNRLNLQATLFDGARLNINYQGSLDMSRGQHSVSGSLKQVDMTHFSPLSVSMFAFPVERGEATVTTQCAIVNGMLSGNLLIKVDQLKLGRKRRDITPTMSIPLKTVTNMLRSASGLIVMDIPLEGDVTSPQFSTEKVVRRAVSKFFLGPLMGATDRKKYQDDEVDLEDIDFSEYEWEDEEE